MHTQSLQSYITSRMCINVEVSDVKEISKEKRKNEKKAK